MYLQALKLRFTFLDLVVGEKGIFADAAVFPLAEHDVDGVVQDAAGEIGTQLGHQDTAAAGMAHRQRQRADVIVVAMGDGDGIQVFASQ